MRCPITPELWQQYQDTGNSQVAHHLASCTACRAKVAEFTRLQAALDGLPALAAPAGIAARLSALAATTPEQQYTCAETLTRLEAWRDGALEQTAAFLVEDHLLWCDPCAQQLAIAETLTDELHQLPRETPPLVIAERIAAARLPWWQRLVPATPAWSRSFSLAAGLAAAVLLVCGLSLLMQTPSAQLAQMPARRPVHPPAIAILPQHAAVHPDVVLPAPQQASATAPVVATQKPARPLRHVHMHHAPVAPRAEPAMVDDDAHVASNGPAVTEHSAPPVTASTSTTHDAKSMVVATVVEPSTERSPQHVMTAAAFEEQLSNLDAENEQAASQVRPDQLARSTDTSVY
jgi:hypothetical protein